MTCNNPNIERVNINAYAKLGQIVKLDSSVCSQDI